MHTGRPIPTGWELKDSVRSWDSDIGRGRLTSRYIRYVLKSAPTPFKTLNADPPARAGVDPALGSGIRRLPWIMVVK
jgi:hypothetical protein